MTHANINEALLGFAAEFGGAHKTGINPHFKSQYMTLDELVRATNPVLQKHGLFVLHAMHEGFVITTVTHAESETFISSQIALPALTDPQKIGSAITYYKRYNLCALLNIAEADDDANLASAPDLATPAQLAIIEDYREAGNVSEKLERWLKQREGKLLAQDADQVIYNIKTGLKKQ
jgi:hypothetical protein